MELKYTANRAHYLNTSGYWIKCIQDDKVLYSQFVSDENFEKFCKNVKQIPEIRE